MEYHLTKREEMRRLLNKRRKEIDDMEKNKKLSRQVKDRITINRMEIAKLNNRIKELQSEDRE